MLHSKVSYPVIHTIFVNGQPVTIRRQGGGTVGEAAAALAKSMLPQKDIALQGVMHPFVEIRIKERHGN